MTSVRRIALAVAALALLALPTSALAKGGDSDRDGMPNRWEKTHGLKVHKQDSRADKDRDGLKNLAEYRLGTDPRNVDSDGDGVEDGQDVGGKVDSFTNGLLTIALPDGTKVSGKVVDGSTELKCKTAQPATPTTTAPAAPTARKADDGHGDDDGDRSGDDGDGDHQDDPGQPAQSAPGESNQHDDGDREDDDENDDAACGVEALTAGTSVHEAELKITSAGAVWDEVELLK
ncbi:MAG TPA: hypothetical protein VK501_03000 [Baekduia sp.]|uniref:hypothetical protein n=1 Tax=Baekduia sp. TaxID=2600305 RepID=UPI002C4D6675|nr:hypothetical protein [Baekduia sp.]HMJ32861.1 hypothetical protein [Baekduia sp.]